MNDEIGVLDFIKNVDSNSVKDIHTLAIDCVENGVSVVFFLYRETKADFIKSVLSEMIGKDIERISKTEDWNELAEAMTRFSNSNIYLEDSKEEYSVEDVYDKIYRLKYGVKQGVQFVVYDSELDFADEVEENLLARKAVELDVGIIYKNGDGVFTFVKSDVKNKSLWFDKKRRINDLIQNHKKS